MKIFKMFLLFIAYSVLLFITAGLFVSKKAGVVIFSKQKEIEKKQKTLFVLNSWVKKKLQNKSIRNYMKINNYHSVAIYGLGDLGKLLSDELKEYVEISYGIDRRDLIAEYPIYKIEDYLPDVDMVIVTVIDEFEEIKKSIKEKLCCPIYSIEDIIYFMD